MASNTNATPISIDHIGLSDSSTYKSLKNNGFKPRRDVYFWPISLPIKWEEDPFNDRNWMFQLHAWRLIDPILFKYAKTKNQPLLEESIAIILDWYNFYATENDNSDSMSWDDMATGLRAMKLAWIWQEISQESLAISNDIKEKIYHLM